MLNQKIIFSFLFLLLFLSSAQSVEAAVGDDITNVLTDVGGVIVGILKGLTSVTSGLDTPDTNKVVLLQGTFFLLFTVFFLDWL